MTSTKFAQPVLGLIALCLIFSSLLTPISSSAQNLIFSMDSSNRNDVTVRTKVQSAVIKFRKANDNKVDLGHGALPDTLNHKMDTITKKTVDSTRKTNSGETNGTSIIDWLKKSRTVTALDSGIAAIIAAFIAILLAKLHKSKKKTLAVIPFLLLMSVTYAQQKNPSPVTFSFNNSNDNKVTVNLPDSNAYQTLMRIIQFQTAFSQFAQKIITHEHIDSQTFVSILNNYAGEIRKLSIENDELRNQSPDSLFFRSLRLGQKSNNEHNNPKTQVVLENFKHASIIEKTNRLYAHIDYLQAMASFLNIDLGLSLNQIDDALAHDSSNVKYKLLKAEILRGQKRNDTALAIYRKLLMNPGNDSLKGIILNGIGMIYINFEDYDKAIGYLKDAIATNNAICGAANLGMAAACNNLATALDRLGQTNEAENYYKQALKIVESVYGRECDASEAIYNNLGILFAHRKIFGISIKYLKTSLKIKQKRNPVQLFAIAHSYLNMGNVYFRAGQDDSAYSYCHSGLSIMTRCVGEQDISLAPFYFNMAEVLLFYPRTNDTINYFKRNLALFDSTFGKIDFRTAVAYHRVGDAYDRGHRYDLAVGYYKHGLDILEQLPNKPDTVISVTLIDLGAEYLLAGQKDKARNCLQQSHASSRDAALHLDEKARKKLDQNDFAECRALEEYALEHLRSADKSKYPELCSDLYETLGQVYLRLGEQRKSERAYKKALIFAHKAKKLPGSRRVSSFTV